jgi:hypothetical protein
MGLSKKDQRNRDHKAADAAGTRVETNASGKFFFLFFRLVPSHRFRKKLINLILKRFFKVFPRKRPRPWSFAPFAKLLSSVINP